MHSLPIGNTTIKKARRLLGIDWRAERASWWDERFDDLAVMSVEEFAATHDVSVGAVINARHAVFGPKLRAAYWWKDPSVARLLLADRPRAEIAAEVDISVSRLPWPAQEVAGARRDRLGYRHDSLLRRPAYGRGREARRRSPAMKREGTMRTKLTELRDRLLATQKEIIHASAEVETIPSDNALRKIANLEVATRRGRSICWNNQNELPIGGGIDPTHCERSRMAAMPSNTSLNDASTTPFPVR